jgi:hypothetical protein
MWKQKPYIFQFTTNKPTVNILFSSTNCYLTEFPQFYFTLLEKLEMKKNLFINIIFSFLGLNTGNPDADQKVFPQKTYKYKFY